MSGWISLQLDLGASDLALVSFSRAMVIGNTRFHPLALDEVKGELQRRPAGEALRIVEENEVFSWKPALVIEPTAATASRARHLELSKRTRSSLRSQLFGTTFARSAYRNFDFQEAMDIAKQGLRPSTFRSSSFPSPPIPANPERA